MPFKKGQSRNPNGRAKKTEAVRNAEELAREASEQAVRKLIALMSSGDQNVELKAANSILDRGFGKPRQSVDVTNRDLVVEALTDAELDAEIARERSRQLSRPVAGKAAPTAH